MISRALKEALANGEQKIGTFFKSANATLAEALGLTELDFIIVDTEHAPNDQLQLEQIIRAADCSGLPTIVRVSNASEDTILKALDLGASGVQIPGLENAEQVREALSYTKYAPLGCRGLSFSQRSAKYGTMDKSDYMRASNEGLINVVHIENAAMAKQAEALCRMDAIDVLFIGPMDISQSLGHPGQPTHPDVVSVIEDVLAACRKYHKATGIFVGTVEAAKKYLSLGVNYIALASDISFMLYGAKQMCRECRS